MGGAAVAIMTAGAFPSFDFDLVVASDEEFEAILLAHGLMGIARGLLIVSMPSKVFR